MLPRRETHKHRNTHTDKCMPVSITNDLSEIIPYSLVVMYLMVKSYLFI